MKFINASAILAALYFHGASASFLRNTNGKNVNEENYNEELVPGESPRELQDFVLVGFKANIQFPTGTFPKGFNPVPLPTGTFNEQPDTPPPPPDGTCTPVTNTNMADEYVMVEYGSSPESDAITQCLDLKAPPHQALIAEAFLEAYQSTDTSCVPPYTAGHAHCTMYHAEFVAQDTTQKTILFRTSTMCNAVPLYSTPTITADVSRQAPLDEQCGIELYATNESSRQRNLQEADPHCSCPRPTEASVLSALNEELYQLVLDTCFSSEAGGIVTNRPQPAAWATRSVQLCETNCVETTTVSGSFTVVDMGEIGVAVERQVVAYSYTMADGVTAPCNNPLVTVSPAPTITPEKTAEPTREPTNEPTRRPTSRPTNRPTRSPTAANESSDEDPTEAPTEEPVGDPTEAPVDPTEAPVDPTEAPVEDPTEAPVDPTEAPVDETEEPTEAPVDPTEAPVEPTDAPTDYVCDSVCCCKDDEVNCISDQDFYQSACNCDDTSLPETFPGVYCEFATDAPTTEFHNESHDTDSYPYGCHCHGDLVHCDSDESKENTAFYCDDDTLYDAECDEPYPCPSSDE